MSSLTVALDLVVDLELFVLLRKIQFTYKVQMIQKKIEFPEVKITIRRQLRLCDYKLHN